MNVSLTPQLEKLVREKVASGKYNSASEVMREALRFLEEHEELHRTKLEALKRDIMVGVADLEAGRYKTYASGRDVFDEIKKGGRRRIAKKATSKK
jgi:antitoxin ParD1/3/4